MRCSSVGADLLSIVTWLMVLLMVFAFYLLAGLGIELILRRDDEYSPLWGVYSVALVPGVVCVGYVLYQLAQVV